MRRSSFDAANWTAVSEVGCDADLKDPMGSSLLSRHHSVGKMMDNGPGDLLKKGPSVLQRWQQSRTVLLPYYFCQFL